MGLQVTAVPSDRHAAVFSTMGAWFCAWTLLGRAESHGLEGKIGFIGRCAMRISGSAVRKWGYGQVSTGSSSRMALGMRQQSIPERTDTERHCSSDAA